MMERFLDHAAWRRLCEDIACSVGMALVLVDQNGTPLTDGTEYENFCGGAEACRLRGGSCARYGLSGSGEGPAKKRRVYLCHAGVVCCSQPLCSGGECLGTLYGKMMLHGRTIREIESLLNLLQTLSETVFREQPPDAAPEDAETISEPETEIIDNFSFRQEMAAALEEHSFRACMGRLRGYVDAVYAGAEDAETVWMRMTWLLQELASLAPPPTGQNSAAEASAGESRRPFSMRYGSRFDGYLAVEQSLKSLFTAMDAAPHVREQDAMDRALNYIEENIRGNLTLHEVADVAEVNIRYFCKIFKRRASMNFIAYVTSRKMELAQDMLRYTNAAVSDIAAELSYLETGYFCKVFKKTVGMTPAEYRNNETARTGRGPDETGGSNHGHTGTASV